jgi:ubiquinone/menaquinone biosynthesis C-methylase UbiE
MRVATAALPGVPSVASSRGVLVNEPAEKTGLRSAWGRVADVYEGMWAARMAHITAEALDMLAPPAGADAVDVACGPGVTTIALSERLGGGTVLGVDFAPAMVERAAGRFGDRPGVRFAVDDAERLSLPAGSADVLTCVFGLMYCYDARAAMASATRTLRPGGRMLQVVWGRAPNVWWVPIIELVETRANYFSAVCPMMFFYGLPGVMARMIGEAGLVAEDVRTIDARMGFADVEEAVEAAIHGFPLAGLYSTRLTPEAQSEVRAALTTHVERLAEPDGGGVSLPAEVCLAVASRPAP